MDKLTKLTGRRRGERAGANRPRRERPPARPDPRISARRVEVARQQGRRRRYKILALLSIAGIVAGSFELVHSSVLGARHVRVFGALDMSKATIVDAAGLAGAPPLVDIDTAAIAGRIEKLPWVKQATVKVSWPTTVDIDVTQRTPVAVVGEAGAPHSWAVVDQYGRVLETVLARPASLPEIGLPEGDGAAGKRYSPGKYLPSALVALAEVAAALPQSLVAGTSEITTSADGAVVEMPGHPLAIVGSASSLRQKFVSLATVLARADLNGVGAIDLRVPTAPVLLAKQSGPIVAGHVGG
ncbi:MAG: cell division protein FtsQ/DivIB [Acidimicrobiales bacterium]